MFILHAKLRDSSSFKKIFVSFTQSISLPFKSDLPWVCGYGTRETEREEEKEGGKIKPGWSRAWYQGRADSGGVVQDKQRKGGVGLGGNGWPPPRRGPLIKSEGQTGEPT